MKKLLQHQIVHQLLEKLPSFRRSLFGVLGSVVLVFLLVSLLSYNLADPAWSHVSSSQEMTNVGGHLGAWSADILRAFFGMGAWFVLLMIGYELVCLWWRQSSVSWVLRLIAYGFLLLCVSAVFAQVGAWWQADQAVVFGGMLGFELATSLAGLFGAVLTMVFLLVFALVVATVTFDIRWLVLWQMLMNKTPANDTAYADELTNQQDAPQDLSGDEDGEFIMHQAVDTTVYQAHNHEGTLESFLVNSGLRAELLAKKQAEQHAQYEQSKQEQPQSVLSQSKPIDHEHDQSNLSFVQSSLVDDTAKMLDEVINDEAVKSPDVLPKNVPQQDDWQTDDVVADASAITQTQFTNAESADVDVNAKWQEQYELDDERVITDDSHVVFDATQVSTNEHKSAEFVNQQSDESSVWQNQSWHQAQNESPNLQAVSSQAKSMATVTDTVLSDSMSVDRLPPSMASGTVRPKSHAMSTLEYRMSLSPVPSLDILDPKPPKIITYTPEELQQLSELLEIKLQEFNIKAQVVSALVGPVVTRFEVDLAAGVKASRVIKVSQDLARSLRMTSLRVIPVIAGKSYIGIEVPNRKRQVVSLIELLDTPDYQDPDAGISIAIGANISGKPVIADLAKAPHMLVAGTTGSGKSVLVNSFLMSMLLKYTPDELKLVLIDPKQLELANYGDIPHLLTPVITDMTEATAALNWCVAEMERRYQLMSKLRVRNIAAFNQKVKEAESAGEPILDLMWNASDHVSDMVPRQKPLSKIVVVADEFADMIMQLGKTAEEPIVRLAQKSRAAGIHLILATQRPVATVVTGLIKSNIPVRVALRVNSATDSRIIIEESGAENMLGHGDMMFLAPGAIETERVHGAYVKDDEVNRVTDAWRERGSPDYIDLTESYTFEGEGSGDTGAGSDDEYFDLAVSHTLDTRKVSISALQRKFSIGYNRAARIVDMMEERGIVSASDNNGKRQILM